MELDLSQMRLPCGGSFEALCPVTERLLISFRAGLDYRVKQKTRLRPTASSLDLDRASSVRSTPKQPQVT